jgi:sorting nexin-41/42
VLNGFSLSEADSLANALEKTGQAIDSTYMSTARLLQDLEQTWTEPLHEYSQFASIIKRLLVYRHQKHVQYEMTQDSLESKRELLTEYEKSEAEAQRLESALSRGTLRSGPEAVSGDGENNPNEDAGYSSFASGSRRHPSANTHQTPRPRRGSYGFFNALSHSIQGLMDVDPEAARRSNISKTRETISQVIIVQVCHCLPLYLTIFIARGCSTRFCSRFKICFFHYSGRS